MRYYIFLMIFLVGVFLNSCTKDFDKINTNPTTYNAAEFDPNYLLTSTQLDYAGMTATGDAIRGNFIYSSTMIQGLASVLDFWVGDKYLLNEQYSGAYFEGAYQTQVKKIVDLLEITREREEFSNLHQIGRLMKAMIFQRITDLYGDVPYFEAGKGYYANVYFPSYDSQEKIYLDLLKEVEEAVNALNPAKDIPTGDAYYNGNITQWERFGNTLLLKIAMRLTKVNPALAKEYANKVKGKTMNSNNDNAYLVHEDAGGAVENRNTRVLNGDEGPDYFYLKWSDTFIDYLKSHNDPRLGKVAVTKLYLESGSKQRNPNYVTDPAVQKGMPNGKDQSDRVGLSIYLDPSYTGFPDYSSVSPFMAKKDGPTFVLTYTESELLIAEAASRWPDLNLDAEEHYNNAIKASVTFLSQYDPALSVSEQDAEDYLDENPFDAGSALENINTQYWVHSCITLNFYEAWINWRRSGFPVLVPVNYPNNVTGGTIPRRFPYPLSEASINPDNYKKASDSVNGGDTLKGKVWWDQ
ncbi:MAG: SusD/RagB family nutrient-binding outer membrane lipoprotein [Bacteroidales bacterium]|nr:SusD/RagB family nutrient-binding outer membrane lipoprotein [Bacteroidales bacterium]